jgi:hypothetical protein
MMPISRQDRCPLTIRQSFAKKKEVEKPEAEKPEWLLSISIAVFLTFRLLGFSASDFSIFRLPFFRGI